MGHGAAQRVGLGEAEAGHRRGHLDDLLLVDDDPVGAAQDALHGGVRHGDRLPAVPPPDERTDHLRLQRAGAEERDGGDDVLEVALLQPRGQVALPRALELEQPDGARRADELVHLGVVARQLPGAHPLAGARLDAAHRLGDGGVHLERQDVHLDEAQRLDVVLVELGHHHALGRPLQGHAVGERVAREDEPAQVRAEMDGEAREPLGDVDQAAVVRLPELVVGELGALGEHLPEPGRAAPRDLAREAVDLLRRETEDAADDAYRRGRPHRVDGGDHGDLVVAEALVDVADDLVAARRAEVDVHVGHLAARRVEEALEEQLVLDGVGVGDAQHVADDAVAGGAAARVVDAAAAREPDDVVHGEEVLGEAELLDDAQLALEPRRDRGGERPIPLGGAREAALPEQREGGLAGRQRVGGEEEPAEPQVQIAARGDARGVGVRLRVTLEEAAHLRRALEVQLGVPAPQRIGQRLAGGLRGEHVVEPGVGLDRVVDVAGGDGGQAQLVGEEVEGAQRGARVRQQLVLQLDEVVTAEDGTEDGGRRAGAGPVAGEQPRPDLAAPAAAERDEVAAVLGERGEPGQRGLARALEVGGADDAAQVAPPGVVPGEQHQVVAAGAGDVGGGGRHGGRRPEVGDAAVRTGRGRRGRIGRSPAGRRFGPRAAVPVRIPHPAAGPDRRLDGELHADDGLDAGRLARLVEAHGAAQPLVVGDRQRRHAQLGRPCDHLGDAAGAVAERERGVQVQVDEAHGRIPR
ncbi:MAG: hypothetical protein BWY94_01993 [Actinobacteria bacterium ADurb.BinA094]|nr:MAG: hypothetical protein BWY94_01993 [Actinobacteria bacterium ADurb.BinA094]